MSLDRPAIDRLLDSVEFAAPVQLSDVLALRAALGDVPHLEVYHTIDAVHVSVRVGGEVLYRRDIPVVGAPGTTGRRPALGQP